MEKEFIPYTEALALKELGFDESCFAGYNTNPVNDDDLRTLIYPTIKLNFEGEDIIFNDTESDQPNCWTIEDDVILAATFSQAFRWFREKYGLHNYVYKNVAGADFWGYYTWKTGGTSPYNSYEEAELACLEKLIKIVESKTEK
jgi:hypothetical protein